MGEPAPHRKDRNPPQITEETCDEPLYSSDKENSDQSDHSATDSEIMRLVKSARNLVRSSSQSADLEKCDQCVCAVRTSIGQQPLSKLSASEMESLDRGSCQNRIHQASLRTGRRVLSLDSAYLLGKTELSFRRWYSCSLQNLTERYISPTLDEIKSPQASFKPQSHEGNNQLAPITTKPAAAIHKSLGELSQAGITQKYSATNVQTSPGNTEHVDDQETRATEVPHASPKGGSYSAGSSKKGKIGLAFLKPKTMVSSQMKSTQMKELKRMIRAGKPSFEQIHSWRNSFEMLLKDRFGLALFKDFLSTEFSDENIEFWIACQEYKQITQPKKLAAKAQRIFDEFIAVQANREVNLDSKTRLETEADLANPTVHTLDNAQKRIQALMEKDSYRRFLRSDVYLTLYSEAREVAKAAASSALAASLQDASDELDGAILHLVNATPSNSPFSFLSNLGTTFNSSVGTGLNLPGVAAAAAKAEAGMNSIQDLQLLGLSTSRHMRNARAQQTQSRVKTAPNHNPRVLSADPPRTEKQPPGVSESDM